MKKIILSLSALFAVSIASAQSYISQPDPTTYEVRQHKAKKAETTPAVQQPEATPAVPATEQPAVKPARQEPKRIDGFSTATATTEGEKQPATATTEGEKQPATATEDKKVAQNRKK